MIAFSISSFLVSSSMTRFSTSVPSFPSSVLLVGAARREFGFFEDFFRCRVGCCLLLFYESAADSGSSEKIEKKEARSSQIGTGFLTLLGRHWPPGESPRAGKMWPDDWKMVEHLLDT